jgi:nitrogen fixation NifU-like protein
MDKLNSQGGEAAAGSDRFLKMIARDDHLGVIDHADGHGKHQGVCGDTVETFLVVHSGRITTIRFAISGCIYTLACANTLAHLMEGRTLAEGWELAPEEIITYLETLPADHHHCAELVVGSFYRALNDHRRRTGGS